MRPIFAALFASVPPGSEQNRVLPIPLAKIHRDLMMRWEFSFNVERALHSVRSVPPCSLARLAVQSERSANRAAPQWFARFTALSGLVLSKDQTPFAPLYWDRYEQMKPRR